MRPSIAWLLARARERSTWLGLTGLLGALGVLVEPDQAEAIAAAGIAVAGAIAALTRDPQGPGSDGK